MKWWNTTWERVDKGKQTPVTRKQYTTNAPSKEPNPGQPLGVGEVLALLMAQLKDQPDALAQVQALHAQLAPPPVQRSPQNELKSVLDRTTNTKSRLRTIAGELTEYRAHIAELVTEQAALNADLLLLRAQAKALAKGLTSSSSAGDSSDEGDQDDPGEDDFGDGQPATPTPSRMETDWEQQAWDTTPAAGDAERWIGFVTEQAASLDRDQRRQLVTDLLRGFSGEDQHVPGTEAKKARVADDV